MTLFENMNLDPLILKSLERMQYKQPSAIQAQAIPLILQGKDLIALSKTGSGKTAACAIPICNKVNPDSPHVQALIIVPTRELAMQYATEAQKIGYEKKVKAFAIFGGEDATMQQAKLKSGVQVLVATPGRLIDFIYSRQIDLTQVDILVLDEADEMLGMGFYDDLAFIINCLVHEHQTLLFSATMQEEIRSMAKKHMKAPQEISLLSNEVSPESIEHRFLYCRYDQRDQALCSLLEELKPKQTIIFCHSRIQCEKVCRTLQRKMGDVDLLHAGLGQDVRSIITNKFRHGKIRHLVATDIAARGLDFSNITHVFIYQLSDSPDVYVHRSGRTGRQERAGVVVTLVTDKELKALSRVLHHIRRKPIWIGSPPPERNHPRKRAVAHKNNKS
ncbi:DEAD-box ATP-dependent RNA helicase CshA [Neochlamydia sp. AcF65]|uniref:DEAD/DEAH box helicase n=1 Tax=unclassified Neochlamydia TaxID=2643326 RepID=UPI00140E4C31|nr:MULTISPECIES: DEAD/DEAH box helicase [unclassified Neochlamydia]MBS4166054.1 DEAD-box ATP-dependent RNA helicase CshA [Neochlamydia sp. AcF65]NGY94536.1 DEAD-box ATP-dependent RNA helicase CshA [Neochlamydia sp. AcF84]